MKVIKIVQQITTDSTYQKPSEVKLLKHEMPHELEAIYQPIITIYSPKRRHTLTQKIYYMPVI